MPSNQNSSQQIQIRRAHNKQRERAAQKQPPAHRELLKLPVLVDLQLLQLLQFEPIPSQSAPPRGSSPPAKSLQQAVPYLTAQSPRK
jgi:hypothetical protein